MCCIREIQYINGEQRIIDKFDLALMDDLTYMSEAIENLLLQNKLNAIKRMSENVTVSVAIRLYLKRVRSVNYVK